LTNYRVAIDKKAPRSAVSSIGKPFEKNITGMFYDVNDNYSSAYKSTSVSSFD